MVAVPAARAAALASLETTERVAVAWMRKSSRRPEELELAAAVPRSAFSLDGEEFQASAASRQREMPVSPPFPVRATARLRRSASSPWPSSRRASRHRQRPRRRSEPAEPGNHCEKPAESRADATPCRLPSAPRYDRSSPGPCLPPPPDLIRLPTLLCDRRNAGGRFVRAESIGDSADAA